MSSAVTAAADRRRDADRAGPTAVRRLVVVTRPTVLELLLADHGTRGQVEFVLRSRGAATDALDLLDRAHDAHHAAVRLVAGAPPLAWRRTRVGRDGLDRFLFEPDDVVATIGPDGLVANVARYVEGQVVIGVDPGDGRSVGHLARTAPAQLAGLLAGIDEGVVPAVDELTMVEAVLDDGRRLRALNEVFVGHRSHQSARYRLAAASRDEVQSSSGLIVATGTGATGWAASIHRATACPVPMPTATEESLLLLVREAWPSAMTGTSLTAARVTRAYPCTVVSAMDDGVVFGDGMETDPLPFDHGRTVLVRPSRSTLRLARG